MEMDDSRGTRKISGYLHLLAMFLVFLLCESQILGLDEAADVPGEVLPETISAQTALRIPQSTGGSGVHPTSTGSLGRFGKQGQPQ